MIGFKNTVVIERPLEEVFAFIMAVFCFGSPVVGVELFLVQNAGAT
jgi:hypothetical protein